MYEIEVADRQSLITVDPEWVVEIVRTTLEAEGVVDAEIVVALLDDPAIHEVNREHLDHDYPTDVISFLYSAESMAIPEDSSRDLRGWGLRLDGEILVSTQTAQRMAQRADWTAANEITLYLVHGLLHLCGYDDLCEEEQLLMRSRERAILQNWNLTPHYQFETE